MRIRADFGVGHPAAEVWGRLASPEGCECVPGLSIGGPEEGSIAFDVGARRLTFGGSAVVVSDPRAHTVTVEAKGVERSGLGKGRVTLLLNVEEDGLFSTVRVEADLHLTGEAASMSRLIAEAAYRLADGVAECLDTALGSTPPVTAAVPEPPQPASPDESEPAPIKVGGWLRCVLRRAGRGR